MRRSSVGNLGERFPDLPTGAWDRPPNDALVVPLVASAQAPPYGFQVFGLNPYRPIDESYRDFCDLVAGQLAASITDARAYEFEKARAETLAELDQAKTDFFTNVSHEFRTPLTLLLGPAEDALHDEASPLEGQQRERVEVIMRNGQRLLKLVNTLLDFSRLESGRVEASFEPVDLAQYTRELASMFATAASRLGLALGVDAPPLPEPVYIDRDLWAKIVLNLLSNALKFTFEGGIGVQLDAHPRRGAARGHRQRHRHPRDGAAAPVRALPPGQRREVAHPRGLRHRARAGLRAGRPARRDGVGEQRAGRRHHVHPAAALRVRAPSGRAARRGAPGPLCDRRRDGRGLPRRDHPLGRARFARRRARAAVAGDAAAHPRGRRQRRHPGVRRRTARRRLRRADGRGRCRRSRAGACDTARPRSSPT